MHQIRAPKGSSTVISRNHHRIQTKVIAMLRLPMGEPQKPAMTNSSKKPRPGSIKAN